MAIEPANIATGANKRQASPLPGATFRPHLRGESSPGLAVSRRPDLLLQWEVLGDCPHHPRHRTANTTLATLPCQQLPPGGILR